ncbi:MAG: NADH:flavin oxidoreductase [Leptospiraceae bacterium]|nr:NADH:flavin oxidoreductase [Leptospiraceae bacterium]MCP5493095.1 NADH:flavin oxidoreductase [Leptospiraceae bacterium]
MEKSKQILFEPIKLKNLELANRIVMAPMTRNFSPNYIPGENVAEYYKKRAANDVGLIITEGTTINHKAANGYPNVPAFHGEKALAGWKKVAEAVHSVGGKIAPQIWHVGNVKRVGVEPNPEIPGYGPMQMERKGKIIGVAMTKEDIDMVVAAYAQAAKDSKEIGFDAVEIHGAHGYLIDQFFWEKTNQRSDEYGGSFEKRMRFGLEVVAAVRKAVGEDFPVIFRFSQWKQQDYEAKLAQNPEELEQLLVPLSNAGVDIFHASTRRFWEPEFEGSHLNLAGWTKKITGKPVISVGSVGLDIPFTSSFRGQEATSTDLSELYKKLKDNEFDMIAIGRSLIGDPELVKKLKQGRDSEIRNFSKDDLKTLI